MFLLCQVVCPPQLLQVVILVNGEPSTKRRALAHPASAWEIYPSMLCWLLYVTRFLFLFLQIEQFDAIVTFHSRYCCKPDYSGFEGAECFHLLRDTELVCKSNHWSCCGSTIKQSTCTRSPPGLHIMRAYSASRLQCYRCSMYDPLLNIFHGAAPAFNVATFCS